MSNFPKQMIPIIIIFAILIGIFIAAQIYLVPDSFGEYGHYRADAVGEVAALQPIYAGFQICVECHDDIVETKAGSNHRGLSCETCHGPAGAHVEAPDEVTPTVPIERDFCLLCHGYNPSRPSGFPQILQGFHNPGQNCMTCHEAHNPELPHAPEDCSACHREIANKKSVSHHTTLPCRRCHDVPDRHLSEPRAARAMKPTDKKLCGECHAKEAEGNRRIPRIELDSHGGRYLCWDCHYPHFPEAN